MISAPGEHAKHNEWSLGVSMEAEMVAGCLPNILVRVWALEWAEGAAY